MDSLVSFLKSILRSREVSLSQLASALGVSHTTVGRWLLGKEVPSPASCQKLAEYTGTRVEWVLSLTGHLRLADSGGAAQWPEFREYARLKYPKELDEDLIAMIEDLIERRRKKNRANAKSRDRSANAG